MKKYLIVLFSVLALASCKKKYTCDCSTVVSESRGGGTTNYLFTFPADKKQYSEKMTKKQAEAACEHQQNAIETVFKNGYKGSSNYVIVSGDIVVTTCSLIP